MGNGNGNMGGMEWYGSENGMGREEKEKKKEKRRKKKYR